MKNELQDGKLMIVEELKMYHRREFSLYRNNTMPFYKVLYKHPSIQR
jgi:hypothetical protein